MGQTADSAPSAPGPAGPPQAQATPDPAQQAHPRTELSQGDAAGEPGGTRTRRLPAWITSAQQQKQKLRHFQEKLEQHRQAGFVLQSLRRFKKIDGKHLALVISLNLFVAVIPLLIIGYAFLEGFNPHHSVGAQAVENLHLTGSTANVVRDTFATAQSGKSVALSISLISLLITGLDVSATAQVAFARAFGMSPLRGVQIVTATGFHRSFALSSASFSTLARISFVGIPVHWNGVAPFRWTTESQRPVAAGSASDFDLPPRDKFAAKPGSNVSHRVNATAEIDRAGTYLQFFVIRQSNYR